MERQKAWQIVCEYVKTDYLRKHALAVEACMRHYAKIYDEDQDSWGIVGLLHDFDYEIHLDETTHPQLGAPILREKGVPIDVIESILSHADHLQDKYPRKTLRDKSLAAVDQLSGLCVAVALVRPTKSIFDVEVKSVLKKWKDKSFAKTVIREEVIQYTNELGITLEENIQRTINALRESADVLGLKGTELNIFLADTKSML